MSWRASGALDLDSQRIRGANGKRVEESEPKERWVAGSGRPQGHFAIFGDEWGRRRRGFVLGKNAMCSWTTVPLKVEESRGSDRRVDLRSELAGLLE
ncbi:hypothetical protein KFK09_018906 [Dendrobium nobile]|uniref:Uncharacterized protein n=1 Tax=Dendrobium nobile TaxID=94219 RepID=A0A8T3AX35_DENNO|nr:hypothetical protein KFK09_018906 [Dendrobium nobile]